MFFLKSNWFLAGAAIRPVLHWFSPFQLLEYQMAWRDGATLPGDLLSDSVIQKPAVAAMGQSGVKQ